MNKIGRVHITVLAVLWLLVHLFLYQHYGIRNLFDSGAYLKRADFIVKHGCLESAHHVFYFVLPLIITFFHWLSPNSEIPFLVFQCVLSALATMALYLASSKIFSTKLAGFLSGILFLIWFDNIHWNITLMTESLLCSFTCFMFYCVTYFKGRAGDFYRVALLSIIILLTRPTGIVVIVGVIAFLIKYYSSSLSGRTLAKLATVGCLLVVSFVGAYWMFTFWDFTDQYKRGNVITFADEISEGNLLYSEYLRVVPHDLNLGQEGEHPVFKMLYFMFNNPVHFLKVGSLKIAYLISAVRPYYSFAHNVYIIVWGSFIYTLYYIGWRNTQEARIKILVFGMILVNCGLIFISTVDWDNRFYIPMEPGIVLLAGGGAAHAINFLKNSYLKLANKITTKF